MQQALASLSQQNDEPAGDAWVAAMRAGDFARAWQISDAVLQQRTESGVLCWHWPRHLQFVWRGQPLAGQRVLVRCYHGLGDTLQFIRFARQLRQLAKEVVVWAQPSLMPLLKSVEGVDRVVPLTDGAPDVLFDVDVEVMELGHALGITEADLARTPYIAAPQASAPLRLAADRPNVGVVWQAGDWDPRRGVPETLIADLARLPGINFVSLQRGPASARASQLGLLDLSLDDVSATAALVGHLDLTITVDTMVAHLVGALGRPVWTLLNSDPDWRWMSGRGHSRWYPSMRMFRQPRAGDWDAVIADVRRDLGARFGGPADVTRN